MKVFYEITFKIKDEFKVDNYVQIVKGSDILAIPDFFSDEKPKDFHNRESHYIYKNNEINTIILMSITANTNPHS